MMASRDIEPDAEGERERARARAIDGGNLPRQLQADSIALHKIRLDTTTLDITDSTGRI